MLQTNELVTVTPWPDATHSSSESSASGGARPADDATYVVYKATSPSGKVYVGITGRTLKARKVEHHYLARVGKNRHFAAALRKYRCAMVWETLEEGIPTLEKANEREQSYIALYRSSDRAHGYNLTEGGAGVVANADTRAKMSASAKKRGMLPQQLLNLERGRGEFWKDRRHSVESKERMVAAHTGRTVSEDTRAKMSAAHKGRLFSEEHKTRIRESNANPVRRSDGCVFSSASEAAKILGLSSDAVAKSIRRGTPCQGFHFTRISVDDYVVLKGR
jgi:group I intron endonuclease